MTAKTETLQSALVKAQGEMGAPRKDREVTVKMKTGGSYKFSYATMAGMIEADRPILAKHGLGFVQFVSDGALVTRIVHEGGEHLDCPIPMPNLPNAPQEVGSIITYFKRYSYSAAFGRVADEEDDANIAEGNGYEPRLRSVPPANGNGHQAQMANDRDAPFPDGPAKNKTQLKDMGRELWKEVLACGDRETLDVLLISHKPLVDQLKAGLPQWWGGGTRDDETYEGLGQVIERMERDFDALEGTQLPRQQSVLEAG